MSTLARTCAGLSAAGVSALALALALLPPAATRADPAQAKTLLKAMSDYLAAQQAVSFSFDANLEVVAEDGQKLALANSGEVILNRPNKIRVTRRGGFADAELTFDGRTMTVLGKNANAYFQTDVPGTTDHLVDELRDTYGRPVPGADLLMSDIYGQLMPEVTEVKDLGSGVISGVECDHFAFRTDEVDWQIWIAQGARPYPCRYSITSKKIMGSPQYSIQIRDFQTGAQARTADFVFRNTTNALKRDIKDIPDTDDLPEIFRKGVAR